MRKRHKIYFLISLTALGDVRAALPLSPLNPPGSNFDLNHWKYTLPDATASEIPAWQLISGYTSFSFYTGPDGAMTFWCPVTGGSTTNSTFPRSELREVINPSDSSINWIAYGTHVLQAQCRVLQQPSTGKIIIGQVHGYNTQPLVKIQWNNGTLNAYVRSSPTGSDTDYTLGKASLGAPIQYQITIQDGVAAITLNGGTARNDFFASGPGWKTNTFYFKAGAYVQDNFGLPVEGGLVAFDQLSASHPAVAGEPLPPAVELDPQSQTVAPGSAVTLMTRLSGSLPMNFQWRMNGVPMPGATTNSLTIANFHSARPVDYDLVMANSMGMVTSAAARVYLNTPLRFVSQKKDSSGRMTSLLAGVANTSYVIEASTNLTTWAAVATNSSSVGLVGHVEAPLSRRLFLRARPL